MRLMKYLILVKKMTEKISSWNIGKVKVTRIVEVERTGPMFVVPDAIPENIIKMPWLKPYFADEEGNTIKHSVQKMKTIEENRTELVYDENGNIQYEKDITEDGEEQFEFEYDTRFLLPDGTLIPNKEEYITRLNNGQEVYIACFVGCSYHCG